MQITRDGATLWLLAAAAAVAYLLSTGTPPTAWSYHQWLQAAAATAAWAIGKLQTSPLPSTADVHAPFGSINPPPPKE